MAIDLTLNGRKHTVATLRTVPGIEVYDSKAPTRARLPYCIVRKTGDENWQYLDQTAREVVSTIRVEIVARQVDERDDLAEQCHDALLEAGRVLDRTQYFEGVDPDMGELADADTAFRVTFQYRIMET